MNAHQKREILRLIESKLEIAGIKPKAEQLDGEATPQQTNPPRQPSEKKKKTDTKRPGKHRLFWSSVATVLGTVASLLGIVAFVLSFLPHLTISSPSMLNPEQGLSYFTIISNDGLLPLLDVKCTLAIAEFARRSGGGISNLGFRSADSGCFEGTTLSPGDRTTFNGEAFIRIPADDVKNLDFRVVVFYKSIFRISGSTTAHFHSFRDTSGKLFLFQSPK